MSNFQTGRGLPHFSSALAFQRGNGLGGVLGRLFRSIIPIFKKQIVRKTLKRIGKVALKSGLSATRVKLENPESSLGTNLKQQLKSNLKDAISRSPIKQKRKRKVSFPARSKSRRKLDIFDFQ